MKCKLAGVVLLMLAAPLGAHTALQRSSPASGSVLTASPPVLTLTFIEPTRLTSLLLVNSAGERALRFTPLAKAKTFSSPKPGLIKGRNEIRWRALSQDGHVIEGSLIIVLRAPKP